MWLRCFIHLACHNVTALMHSRIQGPSRDGLRGYSPAQLQRSDLLQASIVYFTIEATSIFNKLHKSVTDPRAIVYYTFDTADKPVQSVSVLMTGCSQAGATACPSWCLYQGRGAVFWWLAARL